MMCIYYALSLLPWPKHTPSVQAVMRWLKQAEYATPEIELL